MDERANEQLWGAITALNHLLGATWEIFLREADDPLAELEIVRKRNLAEMEPPHLRGVSNEAGFVVSQHAIARLEQFWADMENRLRRPE